MDNRLHDLREALARQVAEVQVLLLLDVSQPDRNGNSPDGSESLSEMDQQGRLAGADAADDDMGPSCFSVPQVVHERVAEVVASNNLVQKAACGLYEAVSLSRGLVLVESAHSKKPPGQEDYSRRRYQEHRHQDTVDRVTRGVDLRAGPVWIEWPPMPACLS